MLWGPHTVSSLIFPISCWGTCVPSWARSPRVFITRPLLSSLSYPRTSGGTQVSGLHPAAGTEREREQEVSFFHQLVPQSHPGVAIESWPCLFGWTLAPFAETRPGSLRPPWGHIPGSKFMAVLDHTDTANSWSQDFLLSHTLCGNQHVVPMKMQPKLEA